MGCLGSPAWASCSGSTSTSAFTPASVAISKNTGIGQVVASATVTVQVTCTTAGSYNASYGWRLNYTPTSPLVSTSIGQGTYATSMSGLGFRMYLPDGTLITPTTYGTNGGDNFGLNSSGSFCRGSGLSCKLTNNTYTFVFRIDLVRTATTLTSGTFSSSLVTFGFQDNYTGAGNGNLLGSETTSPVTFVFTTPSCTVTTSSASQAITLPSVLSSTFASVGSTAGASAFSVDLVNCITQTAVTMTVSGTVDTVQSVLKNTGTAQGIGVQLLNGGAAGSALALNSAIAVGNVGAGTSMSIPMAAQYYRLGTVGAGSVVAVATVTLTYN